MGSKRQEPLQFKTIGAIGSQKERSPKTKTSWDCDCTLFVTNLEKSRHPGKTNVNFVEVVAGCICKCFPGMTGKKRIIEIEFMDNRSKIATILFS